MNVITNFAESEDFIPEKMRHKFIFNKFFHLRSKNAENESSYNASRGMNVQSRDHSLRKYPDESDDLRASLLKQSTKQTDMTRTYADNVAYSGSDLS